MTYLKIEICRSPWKENSFNLRVGDIEGSSSDSNVSMGYILERIKELMIELPHDLVFKDEIKK